MAGELAYAMHETEAAALPLNAKALNYIADAFASEDYIDFTKMTVDDIFSTFDAHGHGTDLRYCQDEFRLQAKNNVGTIVAEQATGIRQQLMQPLTQPPGLPPQGMMQ